MEQISATFLEYGILGAICLIFIWMYWKERKTKEDLHVTKDNLAERRHQEVIELSEKTIELAAALNNSFESFNDSIEGLIDLVDRLSDLVIMKK